MLKGRQWVSKWPESSTGRGRSAYPRTLINHSHYLFKPWSFQKNSGDGEQVSEGARRASEAPTRTALWRIIIPVCLQQRSFLTSGQLEWAKASLQEPAGVIERGQREGCVGGGEGKQFNYEAAAQGHCGSKMSDDGGWRRVCGKQPAPPNPHSTPSPDLPLH